MKGVRFGTCFSLFGAGVYSGMLRLFFAGVYVGYVQNQRAAFERLRLADFQIFHLLQISIFRAWQPSPKAGLKGV